MSLINDALKRAQQVQTDQPAPRAAFKPVERQPAPGPRTLLLVPITLLAVVIAGVALFFTWRTANSGPRVTMQNTESGTVTRTVQAVTVASVAPSELDADVAGAKQVSETPAQPAILEPASTPGPAAQTPGASDKEAANIGLAQPAPVVPSELKLQSILFSSKPSAMISGLIVAEGDRVGTHRVISIKRDRVILEADGAAVELVLR